MSLFISVVITVIGGLILLLEGNKYQQRKVSGSIVRGMQKQSKAKQQIQRNRIEQLDPFFSEEQIKRRIEQAFFIIKHAYASQESATATAFISDGFAESMNILFEIQQHRNKQWSIEDLSLIRCELVGIEADKHAETVHFKINSSARFTEIDATHRIASANKTFPLQNTIEYWTYVRLPGVKTRQGDGLIEGICPNCGVNLVLSQFSLCESCGSLVGSGEYDWVLTKITNESQWRFQNAKRQITGVSEYQVVDPAFNVPLVEDRVCAIFWRIQKAWLIQKVDPLLSVATPAFIDKFSSQLQGYCFDNIELGLCELSRIHFGDALNGNFDRIHLLIKWQGGRVELDNGKSCEKGFYAHHVTLIRLHGVKSDSKKGLHSLHCFGCGAPQTVSYQDTCHYCGRRFNTGEQTWVIDEFIPHLDHIFKIKGQEFALDKPPEKRQDRIFDPVSLLSSLVLVLYADGKVSQKEHKLLNEFVQHRRIPEQVLADILAAAECGELQMQTPDETLDASDWINKLIEMCLADGIVCQAERKLLIAFGKKFNILPVDINLRIKSIQRDLYIQSKKGFAQSE